ncbi:DUF2017 family protein [Demequina flava]|uniref:DUF2017 family protein n=1 Tax=Demequina flava TaxID=1095025 RepID=UPI000784EBF3|nr:DUF2017 family protein [Demequina flava]
MRGFVATDNGAVAQLDDEERTVVARIVADVGLLLGGEPFGMTAPVDREQPRDDEDALFAALARITESVEDPDDPAVLALLPHASDDDRELAQEFRRLTEEDLRLHKTDRLRRMWEDLSQDGPDWLVPFDECLATASALTDIRLVLASRLGLDSDDDGELLRSELATAIEADDEPASRSEAERIWLGMLYESLGWLQQSLLDTLMEDDDDEL